MIKKVFATLFFLFLAFGISESQSWNFLKGTWQFDTVISGEKFTFYFTITSVNKSSRLVQGSLSGYSRYKIRGYWYLNTAFIQLSLMDDYIIWGYHFTFITDPPAFPRFCKMLITIPDNPHPMDSMWFNTTYTKVSSSALVEGQGNESELLGRLLLMKQLAFYEIRN